MPRVLSPGRWAAVCLLGWGTHALSYPSLNLPLEVSSGQSAIDLLGQHLPEVAAAHRRSPQALRQWLLSDPALHLDRHGRLFMVDTLEAALPRPPAPAAASAAPAANLVLKNTFVLHSRPGASRTIYLDFDGGFIKNTAWNSSNPEIYAIPFDMDGDSTQFSDAEKERIQYIWQRVAEDFAPFDVDVTTEPPAPDRLTRSSSTDGVYGTTVMITHRSGVYNCSCGGVAYVGVFDAVGDFYKPALVFFDALYSDEKNIAEAISHEAGHNLGLAHDGYSGGGYYYGHGSGDTGWAPIMGAGYYQPVTQWSRGEYATANNAEDDFQVIQSNGAPLRADDHGNSRPSASPLSATAQGSTTTVTGAGVIEQASDKDMFSFAAGAGPAKFNIQPDDRAPNLDVSVQIQDSQGQVLARAKPAAKLSAGLNVTLPAAGTYYLLVMGVGTGDPLGTGYSDYGSVGQYRIKATVPTP